MVPDDRGEKQVTILEQIREFAKENISPALASHGGDLEILDYDAVDRVVKVKYISACAMCPHSALGTHAVILTLLQSEFPEEVADIERV